jgi:alpha-glucosidase (family GH31 glycosyl hydrolase)
MYLGQDSLESVNEDINTYLKNGSRVSVIAKSLLGSDKATLIITKWYGGYIDEFNEVEQVDIFTQYINECFADDIKRSCVSLDIKRLMESNYYGVDMDEYSDYLTELMNSNGYQKVNHHITNIMACFKPYMLEKYPKEFENMNVKELEVALIDFVKEHLCACTNKKTVTLQDKNL